MHFNFHARGTGSMETPVMNKILIRFVFILTCMYEILIEDEYISIYGTVICVCFFIFYNLALQTSS